MIKRKPFEQGSLALRRSRKALDMSDERTEDEIADEFLSLDDPRTIDLLRSSREEGHIYESIEDELEVEDVALYDDLLNDHLGIDSD